MARDHDDIVLASRKVQNQEYKGAGQSWEIKATVVGFLNAKKDKELHGLWKFIRAFESSKEFALELVFEGHVSHRFNDKRHELSEVEAALKLA